MKKRLAVIFTVIIAGAVFAAFGYLYFYVFTIVGLSPVLRGIIVLISLLLVVGLVVAGWQRFQEIREEEQDDLSKY